MHKDIVRILCLTFTPTVNLSGLSSGYMLFSFEYRRSIFMVMGAPGLSFTGAVLAGELTEERFGMVLRS